MKTSRPYLLRAMFEWINDNECTPFILVNADYEGTIVPRQSVSDGKIVLNLGASATRNLILSNEQVRFMAAFSGVPMEIIVPIQAVIGIYASENGQGMIFELEAALEPEPAKPARQRPALKVIK